MIIFNSNKNNQKLKQQKKIINTIRHKIRESKKRDRKLNYTWSMDQKKGIFCLLHSLQREQQSQSERATQSEIGGNWERYRVRGVFAYIYFLVLACVGWCKVAAKREFLIREVGEIELGSTGEYFEGRAFFPVQKAQAEFYYSGSLSQQYLWMNLRPNEKKKKKMNNNKYKTKKKKNGKLKLEMNVE